MKVSRYNSWGLVLGVFFLSLFVLSCGKDRSEVIAQDAQFLAELQCNLKLLQTELFEDSSKHAQFQDSLIQLQKSISDFQMEIHTAYQTLEDKELFSEAYRASFTNCKQE